MVKLTGFGGELNVKKKQKKSNMTPVFDLSKDGDAEISENRVEEQTWCKLNPVLDMLSFEILINYPNGDID